MPPGRCQLEQPSPTVTGSRPGEHGLAWGASDGSSPQEPWVQGTHSARNQEGCVAAAGEGEEGVTPGVSEEEGGDHDVASSGPQP